MFDNIRNWYRSLPEKKKYLELLSAVLTIPVLVTVIMLNLNNLSQKNTAKQTSIPTPAVIRIVETLQPVNIMQTQQSVASSSTSSAPLSPTPTATPAITPTLTPTATSTPSPTPAITNTPTPLAIPTVTASSSAAMQ